MKFFASDFKKYFYLAELYSLIDLSSVSMCCGRAAPMAVSWFLLLLTLCLHLA